MMRGLKPLSLVKRTDLKGNRILFLFLMVKSFFPLKNVFILISFCLTFIFTICITFFLNADFIIFDKQSSERMRQNLKTLVDETARQQNMIQELIETNQQLK